MGLLFRKSYLLSFQHYGSNSILLKWLKRKDRHWDITKLQQQALSPFHIVKRAQSPAVPIFFAMVPILITSGILVTLSAWSFFHTSCTPQGMNFRYSILSEPFDYERNVPSKLQVSWTYGLGSESVSHAKFLRIY